MGGAISTVETRRDWMTAPSSARMLSFFYTKFQVVLLASAAFCSCYQNIPYITLYIRAVEKKKKDRKALRLARQRISQTRTDYPYYCEDTIPRCPTLFCPLARRSIQAATERPIYYTTLEMVPEDGLRSCTFHNFQWRIKIKKTRCPFRQSDSLKSPVAHACCIYVLELLHANKWSTEHIQVRL